MTIIEVARALQENPLKRFRRPSWHPLWVFIDYEGELTSINSKHIGCEDADRIFPDADDILADDWEEIK